MGLIKINNDKLKTVKNDEARKKREMAYASEADPLFFKYQRGEITQQEWEAKVAEIKVRFPYVS